MDDTDGVVFTALLRESGLIAEHLGIGATALGKASFGDAAAYYSQAFFALSVGIERGAKLALSINAALNKDGDFLSGEDLRTYGHNLDRLLQAVEEIAKERELSSQPRPDTEIHRGILATLTAFAMNVTRYYNLEVLAAGDARDPSSDPLAMWHTLVTQPVLRAHYTEANRNRDQARALATGASAGPHASVRSIAETGAPISSLADLTMRSAEAQVARPWERMYVLQLCRFLGTVIEELGKHAQAEGLPVPFLREFFWIFRLSDRDFRVRKVWSIH
jgi:hypothetical protein